MSVERHIKQLFHAGDRQVHKLAFDLWSYHDLRLDADGIAQRLRDGPMPCDGAWPPEKIESFERRVQSGTQA